MDPNEKQRQIGKTMSVLTIIWVGMLASLGVYVAVAFQVGPTESGMAPAQLRIMRYILMGMGIAELGGAVFLQKFLLRAAASPNPAPSLPGVGFHPAVAKFTMATILVLAISESIGIFGLVLYLLGAGFSTLYLFIGVSAAAMFYFKPRSEVLDDLLSGQSRN